MDGDNALPKCGICEIYCRYATDMIIFSITRRISYLRPCFSKIIGDFCDVVENESWCYHYVSTNWYSLSLYAYGQRWASGNVDILWDPLPVYRGKHTKWHRSGVHEVLYDGRPATSKIACFEWDIPRIEDETAVNRRIKKLKRTEAPPLALSFLGHLAENSHVIDMLLKILEVRLASIDDLPACEEALRRLHCLGLSHGDVNRYCTTS